MTYFVTY